MRRHRVRIPLRWPAYQHEPKGPAGLRQVDERWQGIQECTVRAIEVGLLPAQNEYTQHGNKAVQR